MNDGRFPIQFGGTWDAFVNEWCCGCRLAHPKPEVVRAIRALGEHWPEKISETVAGIARGPGPVAGLVEYGLLLSDCDSVEGFAPVLKRLKEGDRSAYSELVVGTTLVRLGYSPSFTAPIGNKNLDAVCSFSGQDVYFEVVCPEHSQAVGHEDRQVRELSTRLRDASSGYRLEVVILQPLTDETIAKIVDAATDAVDAEWMSVPGVARLRKISLDSDIPPTFDAEGSVVNFGRGTNSASVIRWEYSDERAARIFYHEYQHFSSEVPNVLVVNTCAVGGVEEWAVQIERLFQPSRNRKCGAALLFHQGIIGPPEAIRRRWAVVRNPYAHLQIPDALFERIETLDELSFF